MEPALTTFLLSALATGIMTGAETGGRKAYDVFDDHRRERAFSEDVEDLAVEFNKSLRHELERRANEEGIEELQGINRRWEPIARELNELDDFTRVRASEDDAAEPIRDVIDHLAETIADVDGLDMDDPVVERTIKGAVEEAYEDAVERFAGRLSKWPKLQDEFNTRTGLKLTDATDRALIHLREIRQNLRKRRYYERIDTDEKDWLAQVAALLDTETRVPFVDRDELEGLPENERTLLLGRKGSGKSRALIELADRLGDEVDHVVVPQEQLMETSDLDRLLEERFDGDVALFWDDVHDINPADENQVFEVGVSKLGRELREEGHTLYVLAAARSEEHARLPRDYNRRRSYFDVETVQPLGRRTLVDVFEAALASYEVDTDERTKAEFVRRAIENDPSPFYVVSIVSLAEGGRLTNDDVEQFPPDALGVWEEQYEDLRNEHPEAHTALRAVWLLRSCGLPTRQWLVERVAASMFDQPSTEFERGVGRLADMHWLVAAAGHDSDPTHTYRIHDVQLEAVGPPRGRDLGDLSSFLLDELSDPDSTPREETEITPRDLHRSFASAMQERGELDTAEEHYRHILTSLDPEDATVHNNYGVLLRQTGRPADAGEHFTKALGNDPEYAEAHSNYALLLSETGRPADAEEHYIKALKINPGLVEAHYNYANLLGETGRLADAEEHLTKALEIDPKRAGVHTNYANLLSETGRPADAEEHLTKALEINPGLVEAHNNYANLLSETGRLADAEKHLTKALEINSKNAEAHNNYANLLKKMGRPAEAEEHYTKALEIDPDFTEAHFNYANFLSETGRLADAEEHLTKALGINPEYVEAHTNYADLLAETGRPAEAEEHYTKALEINPEYAETHTNYALLLSETGRPADAEEHLTKALEINPGLVEAHYNYANLLLDEDRPAEASSHLGTTIDILVDRDRIGDAVLVASLLITACEQSGPDASEAVETSEGLVASLAESPELSERAGMGVARLLRARPEAFVPVVYGTLNPELLAILVNVIRDGNVPDAFESYAASAGAWLLPRLPDGSTEETEIVLDLTGRRDRLRLPARGVFDLVSRGETGVTPEAVTAWAHEAADGDERELREREADRFRDLWTELGATDA